MLVDPLERGVFGFRVAFWLMAATLLVSFIIDSRRRQELAFKTVLTIGSVLAAYAMYRWIFGAGAKEAEASRALGQAYVESNEGDLRAIGALLRPQLLGAWCSVLVPFGLIAALSPIGTRWRVVGAGLAGACVLILGGTDTRVAMAGTAVAIVTTLMLFGVSRGYTGQKTGPLVVGVLVVVLGFGGFAATRLESKGSEKQRFEGLFNPTQDESFQERLIKWESILDDLDSRPLGRGVGASGAAEVRYARFSSAVSNTPDSTYVKVAYDQGLFGLAMLASALLAMFAGLVALATSARTALGSGVADCRVRGAGGVLGRDGRRGIRRRSAGARAVVADRAWLLARSDGPARAARGHHAGQRREQTGPSATAFATNALSAQKTGFAAPGALRLARRTPNPV